MKNTTETTDYAPETPDRASHVGDDEFGNCPICGHTNGYRNIYKAHWFYCNIHRVKWLFGINMFSGWRYEDQSEWEDNARYLANFRDITNDDDTPQTTVTTSLFED